MTHINLSGLKKAIKNVSFKDELERNVQNTKEKKRLESIQCISCAMQSSCFIDRIGVTEVNVQF